MISAINGKAKHLFLTKCQANFLKAKKESLKVNKVIVVLGDFADNYQFLVEDWSNECCTLHPLIVYFIDSDGNIQNNSLCLISDDNNLSTNFVYKIKTILVDYLKENLTVLDKIFYFSDSSVEQYKNHKSFINLCHHQQDFNMDAEWIVFAANHGKSQCVL